MNVLKRILRIFCYVMVALGITGLTLCVIHSDKLMVRHYVLTTDEVNNPHTYVVISDLHHRGLTFEGGVSLIDTIKQEEPEAVFMIGDMIDNHIERADKDPFPVMDKLVNGLSDYPIYYVTGNHEDKARELYDEFVEHFKDKINIIGGSGPTEDKSVTLAEEDGKKIVLYGLHDPSFDYEGYNHFEINPGRLGEALQNFDIDPNNFNILLEHRPELVDFYGYYDFDAMFAGHSHGGQIVLGGWSTFSIPGGTFNYVGGEYDYQDGKKLYVSRGLGYSAMLPIRINCNPEIISFTVQPE
ncbi:MAG: metallophosphoesterase [Bacilli bacterium]|nr:metallophosphoesterase [Bacilli bacterium]